MTDFAGGLDRAEGVAVQPDGRIVAAGVFRNSLGKDYFGVARYGGGGALDGSFSADGKQITAFGGESAEARGVALQPDGKVVVAGITQGASSTTLNFAVARYTSTGALDSTFSGDGKQTTDFAGDLDEAETVALQADGKIVVAGRTRQSGSFNFAVARYTSAGALDTTFSGDGKQRTDFDGFNDVTQGLGLQADGKIVAVGGVRNSIGSNFGIARYNANGGLDQTFSSDGRQKTDFAGAFDAAASVALQPDGRMVVAGRAATAGGNDNFALARYNTNGGIDETLSGDGKQTTDFIGGDSAHGVALQADGRIIAAGTAQSGSAGSANFGVARYTAGGALDSTFSGNGRAMTDFAGGSDAGLSVALQPNGAIVVAGGASTGSPPNGNFGIARYLGG